MRKRTKGRRYLKVPIWETVMTKLGKIKNIIGYKWKIMYPIEKGMSGLTTRALSTEEKLIRKNLKKEGAHKGQYQHVALQELVRHGIPDKNVYSVDKVSFEVLKDLRKPLPTPVRRKDNPHQWHLNQVAKAARRKVVA